MALPSHGSEQKTVSSEQKNPAVEIRKTIRGSVPRIPFENIARAILSSKYELSLVLCGDVLARRMNKIYRKKGYAPNVLSFPLSRSEGEIFLNVRKATREANALGIPLSERLALLFVHGCYHLLGLAHGEKMERLEKKTLAAFGFIANF